MKLPPQKPRVDVPRRDNTGTDVGVVAGAGANASVDVATSAATGAGNGVDAVERARTFAALIRDDGAITATVAGAVPGGGVLGARLARGYDDTRALARKILGAPGGDASTAVGFGVAARSAAGSAEVIAALAKLDLSSLKSAGIETVATLDFDNTLVPGDTFVAFCAHLAETGAVDASLQPRLVALIGAALGDGAILGDGALRESASALLARAVALHVDGKLPAKAMLEIGILSFRGHSVDALREMARAMFVEYGKNAFAPDHDKDNSARALIAALHHAGIEPHVVSAGMRFLGQVGAEALGINGDNVFGGELAVDGNGVCTGVLAYDVASVGKAAVIRDKIGVAPVFAFGDSPGSDAPMLAEAIVQGFMINASEKFLQKADDEDRAYVAMHWR